jgi:hypothetical protein
MATPKAGYTIDGVKVPGVTTVLGVGSFMPTDALCTWSAKLAKAGKDWRAQRDRAGFIGSAIHDAIEHYPAMPVKKDEWTVPEWERIFAAWEAHDKWWQEKRPAIVVQEVQLLSRELMCGGTPDLVVRLPVEGKEEPGLFLLDHKSGKSAGGPKEAAQMGAYAAMLKEQLSIEVEGCIILHHPEGQPFTPIPFNREQLAAGLATFKACRQLYSSMQALKKALPPDPWEERRKSFAKMREVSK